jgi:hypothetical protein
MISQWGSMHISKNVTQLLILSALKMAGDENTVSTPIYKLQSACHCVVEGVVTCISQVAVSANYHGVRWSGNSLCISSEYGLTLTCT